MNSYKQRATRRKGLTPEKRKALIVLLGEALAADVLTEMGEEPATTAKAVRYKQAAPVESVELPVALARALEQARRRLPDDELIRALNAAARQTAAGKAYRSDPVAATAAWLEGRN